MLFISPMFKYLEKRVLPKEQSGKTNSEKTNLLWSMIAKNYNCAFKYLSDFQIEDIWKNCPQLNPNASAQALGIGIKARLRKEKKGQSEAKISLTWFQSYQLGK